MTHAPASCDPATTLRLVAQLMTDHDCAAIPVTDSGILVGIITDRDIVARGVAHYDDSPLREARTCMTTPVIAVHVEDDVNVAIDLMAENGIHHIPVIDAQGHLLGIVSQSDLGRRMTNREFGQLARSTSIRMKFAYRPVESVVRRDH